MAGFREAMFPIDAAISALLLKKLRYMYMICSSVLMVERGGMFLLRICALYSTHRPRWQATHFCRTAAAWPGGEPISFALHARCFRKFISSLLVLFATVFVLLVFYGCSHYNKPAGKRRAINITEIIVVWFHLSFITSLASEL